MTPLVIEIIRSLERRPLPYLLATAIDSAATITGYPQKT